MQRQIDGGRDRYQLQQSATKTFDAFMELMDVIDQANNDKTTKHHITDFIIHKKAFPFFKIVSNLTAELQKNSTIQRSLVGALQSKTEGFLKMHQHHTRAAAPPENETDVRPQTPAQDPYAKQLQARAARVAKILRKRAKRTPASVSNKAKTDRGAPEPLLPNSIWATKTTGKENITLYFTLLSDIINRYNSNAHSDLNEIYRFSLLRNLYRLFELIHQSILGVDPKLSLFVAHIKNMFGHHYLKIDLGLLINCTKELLFEHSHQDYCLEKTMKAFLISLKDKIDTKDKAQSLIKTIT